MPHGHMPTMAVEGSPDMASMAAGSHFIRTWQLSLLPPPPTFEDLKLRYDRDPGFLFRGVKPQNVPT